MIRHLAAVLNSRVVLLLVTLLIAASFTVRGVRSQSAATRKAIHLPTDNPQLPFSGAILAGNTLYLSGRIGIDAKTGKAPEDIDQEIKLLLDEVKATTVAAGMS